MKLETINFIDQLIKQRKSELVSEQTRYFYKLKEKYQVDDMSECITDVERCAICCHNEDIEEIDKIYKDFVNTQWMYEKNNEDLNIENDTEKKL